jgi:hypothetical protein
MLDSRLLATRRHPYREVSFGLTSGEPELFLRHELLLDHQPCFEEGYNHGVAFITDRNGSVYATMARHSFDAHLFTAQRFVNDSLPFMHSLADTGAPCFDLRLLDPGFFGHNGAQ